MATERLRYVDTGSAGGNGTTAALSGANAAYATLFACEAAEDDDGDLTAGDGEWLHISCAATGGIADTTAVVWNGFTTSATCYILIEGATGHRASASWSTSKYRLEPANATALTIYDDYVYVDGLQIGKSSSSAHYQNGIYYYAISASVEQRVSNCLIKMAKNNSYAESGIFVDDADVVLNVWNTIIYNLGNVEAAANAPLYCGVATTVNAYNSVFIGGGYYGVRADSEAGTITCKNCYASGSSAGYSGVDSLTECASSDANSGSEGLRSVAVNTTQFVNVTGGSEDFHLAGTGSALYRTGTDTSGDAAPMNFTTDIDGDAYYDTGGARSIGADEYVAAAPSAVNIVYNII